MHVLPRAACSVALTLGLLAGPSHAETPDDLPAQAAGVVGSGAQLSLQLRPAGGPAERTMRIGDAFPDGWVLTGLTNTAATLSRGGVTRAVGLNPTGATPAPAAQGPASTVRVIGGVDLPPEALAALALSDEQVIEQLSPAARRDYATLTAPGLTLAESQRYTLLAKRADLMTPALVKMAQANVAAAKAQGINAAMALDGVMGRILGSEFTALQARQAAYNTERATAQYQAALAAGIGMVLERSGQPRQISNENALGMAIVAYTTDGNTNLFMPAPRSSQPGIGVSPPPAIIPALTEADLAGLTLNGAPLDSAIKTDLLAGNRQIVSARANPPDRPAGAALYGPFGAISP